MKPVWLGAAGLIVLSFLFPPIQVSASALRAPSFAGYAWLWTIPKIEYASVAWPLLLVQWVGLALVGGLVWLAVRAK